jgi:hypothetical protein
MVFTYSGNPNNSDLDQVRFELQDTDETDALFSDNELNFLIDKYKQLDRVIYEACKILIAKYSRFVDESQGKVSIRASQLVENYRNLLREYELILLANSCIYIGGVNTEEYENINNNKHLIKHQFSDNDGDNPRVWRRK